MKQAGLSRKVHVFRPLILLYDISPGISSLSKTSQCVE